MNNNDKSSEGVLNMSDKRVMCSFLVEFIVVVATVLLPTILFADGKMYVSEEVNVDIPYQRALVVFKDNQELLVVQSKYSVNDVTMAPEIGWVVPVPNNPELASLSIDDADEIFDYLSMHAQPHICDISNVIVKYLEAIFVILMFVMFFVTFIAYVFRVPGLKEKRLKLLMIAAIMAVVVISYPPLYRPMELGLGGAVDLLQEKTVGVYDVAVVKADSADAIVDWLNERNFKYGPEDKAVFDKYISQGWCFVTAVIKPDMSEYEKTKLISSEGLASPLVLKFDTESAVYPMALTGSGGFDTEVLVYVVSKLPASCDGKMKLRKKNYWYYHNLEEFVYSEDFLFEPKDISPKFDLDDDVYYLTKFKSVLTPEQMKEDIVFMPDNNLVNYSEVIYQW